MLGRLLIISYTLLRKNKIKLFLPYPHVRICFILILIPTFTFIKADRLVGHIVYTLHALHTWPVIIPHSYLRGCPYGYSSKIY